LKNTKTDRRSQRTRRLLAHALTALLPEKRFDRITVQDIIDRADVGRSTFYAHYRDKEDLLVSEFARVLDVLMQHLGHGSAEEQQLLPSLALFRHIQEEHQLYQALVRGRGVELLFKAGQQHLSKVIAHRIAALPLDPSRLTVPPSILAEYLAGSLLTLLRWWLDHDMPYTPERMHAIFQELVTPGVQQVLGGTAP
jgi:AcrR family transcriptional regulator